MRKISLLAALAVFTTGTSFAANPFAKIDQTTTGNVAATLTAENSTTTTIDQGAAGNTAFVKKGHLKATQKSAGGIGSLTHITNVSDSNAKNNTAGNAITLTEKKSKAKIDQDNKVTNAEAGTFMNNSSKIISENGVAGNSATINKATVKATQKNDTFDMTFSDVSVFDSSNTTLKNYASGNTLTAGDATHSAKVKITQENTLTDELDNDIFATNVTGSTLLGSAAGNAATIKRGKVVATQKNTGDEIDGDTFANNVTNSTLSDAGVGNNLFVDGKHAKVKILQDNFAEDIDVTTDALNVDASTLSSFAAGNTASIKSAKVNATQKNNSPDEIIVRLQAEDVSGTTASADGVGNALNADGKNTKVKITQENTGDVYSRGLLNKVSDSTVRNGAAGNTATITKGKVNATQKNIGQISDFPFAMTLTNVTSSTISNNAAGNAMNVGF